MLAKVNLSEFAGSGGSVSGATGGAVQHRNLCGIQGTDR
jgi:hypothetical protein